MPYSATKDERRAQAKSLRAGLDMPAFSAAIRQVIAAHACFHTAKVVVTYAALPGEIDLAPLRAAHPEKQWLLPRCGLKSTLTCHAVTPETPLIKGPFGLQEPAATAPIWDFEAAAADMILVPALLVACNGMRLGYGKGYYDRFLAGLSKCPTLVCPLPTPLLVESLPEDPWDIAVNWIVTEQGWESTV